MIHATTCKIQTRPEGTGHHSGGVFNPPPWNNAPGRRESTAYAARLAKTVSGRGNTLSGPFGTRNMAGRDRTLKRPANMIGPFGTKAVRIDPDFELWHSHEMVRVQIQLPDELYAEAKQVCEEKEMSLSELACRGIERMTSPKSSEPWSPPTPRNLGWSSFTEEEIKSIAQDENREVNFRKN